MKRSFFTFIITLLTACIAFSENSSLLKLQKKSNIRHIAASNSRSDTISILNYSINLTIADSDITNKTIGGYCTIIFTPKMNTVSGINLDLLAMIIDSVKMNNQLLTYLYYKDTLLKVNLPTLMSIGDTGAVTVYYHGSPQLDPSGAGGFYFTSGCAFNLGDGRSIVPHCFGRVWYPCFDNFIQRATYDFHITTDSLHRASCNGYLVSATGNGNGTTTWNWQLNNAIPSYLANVAVSTYTTLSSNYYSINGDTIPVLLTALPSDTAYVKTAFVHLPNAFSIFENHYGPYRWNKVGYVFVPFTFMYDGYLSTGAVEQATNIAYGELLLANGATTYETRMAHELSHHWFGDLITCQTEGDMWLNEGWAQYSEKIFLENLYGENSYLTAVKANHITALQFAHVNDSSYLAVSPAPDEYTYGNTVYDVGSDAVHTLRAYMGDSPFFHCLQNYLHDNAFTSQSSYNFRDYLSSCSSIDLTDFFNDWIFNPGYAHFSIDSVKSAPAGNDYNVTVYVRQRLDNAPAFYNNVPIEVTFMDNNFDSVTYTYMMSGACIHCSATLPFNPTFTCLNMGDKIGYAVTDQFQHVKTAGTYDFTANTFMKITVSSVGADSALVHVEHNWVRPDAMKHPIPGLILSDYHYWKVDGILDSNFTASASISFNGTNSATNGYLDNTLITNSDDSLVVMYRPGTWSDWVIDTNVVLTIFGSPTSKLGNFTINQLKKGEYTLAIWDHRRIDTFTTYIPDSCETISGITPQQGPQTDFSIYPNPAQDNVNIVFSNPVLTGIVECYSAVGTKVYSAVVSPNQNKLILNIQNWAPGIYIACLRTYNNSTVFKKVVVIH